MEDLKRSLDLRATIALVVGTVIGTGVFLKAAVMAEYAGSPALVLLAWVVAGVLSLAGAFCYAELGSLFPRAGGEYVFLREAYGDLVGFLYGWMRFSIATPGSIAAYGVGAATFLRAATGWDQVGLVATAIILFFSAVNCASVLVGGRVQVFLTALKLAMIAGLVGAIFIYGGGSGTTSLVAGEWKGPGLFGAALLAALWAYDGWNNMPMAAGEIVAPERTIPRALIFGMLGVLAVYVVVNFSFFYALTFEDVASSYSRLHPEGTPVAVKAARAVLGDGASLVLSIAFVISAFGSMNGAVLTGARIPYAMARDGLFFRGLAKLNGRTHAPVAAVVVQAFIASAFALTSSFDQLTDYVVFASWIFYALAASSLFVFRRRIPRRPYAVPFYPWLPAAFLLGSTALVVNTLWTASGPSLVGAGLIAVGVPVYFLFRMVNRSA